MLVSRRLRAKAAAVAVVGLTLMLGACTKSSNSSEGDGGQNAAQQVQEQSGSGCTSDKYAGGVEKLDLKSVTVERGLTTPNLFAAATDQALAAAARQVVVLADSAKIGKDTMCQTVPSPDIDVLITDSGVDAEELRRLREADMDVRVARLPLDRSAT